MTAYEKNYLDQNMKLHRLLFKMYKQSEFDLFECISEYLKTSKIRKNMDNGNWSALNKGVNQLWNSISYSNISKKKIDYSNVDTDWMANIYTFFQWKYDIMSEKICEKIPPKTLDSKYNPLHETSIQNACEKLYSCYFKEGNLND